MTSSPPPTVTLRRLDGEYAITRLDPHEPVPPGLLESVASASFCSVTRTASELSIVTPVNEAPPRESDAPWVAWYVGGSIPFRLTGVGGHREE